MMRVLGLCIFMLLCTNGLCDEAQQQAKPGKNSRQPKLFQVLQVVQFQNTACASTNSNRNGTCYTPAECTNKGGTASGSCASGYGVCCVITLGCGGTSSENNTYIVQASTTATTANAPCAYTICRCNSNICRIRLDFTAFNIAGPVPGTTLDAAAATTNGAAVGDCATDTFVATSPGSTGSPVICGVNTGQHMYLDASSLCNVASFDLGGSSIARNWDIKVTQYTCGDPQGGPSGCLQYFTGTSGTVSSFNFPPTPTAAPIGASTTHLSNQQYSMCFRQESGMCSICFIPSVSPAAASTAAIQNSFGLSVSPAVIATGGLNAMCTSDYLQISGATDTAANAVLGTSNNERICGRFFSTTVNAIAGASVCSAVKPFQMQFFTDSGEEPSGATAILNEQNLSPGGIVGFSLNYVEQPCVPVPAG